MNVYKNVGPSVDAIFIQGSHFCQICHYGQTAITFKHMFLRLFCQVAFVVLMLS